MINQISLGTVIVGSRHFRAQSAFQRLDCRELSWETLILTSGESMGYTVFVAWGLPYHVMVIDNRKVSPTTNSKAIQTVAPVK